MTTALLVVGMIACTVIANLLLKTGAVMGREEGGALWMQLANWHVVAGLGSFGVAGLLYTMVLRTLPLNIALSFTAAQWMATVLAAALVLGEPIGSVRWIGIALIASGIALVGWTQA